MLNFDEIKKELEKKADGEFKIKTVIDYDEEHVVIVLDVDTIPGKMFKINKKTGETSYYLPAADMKKWLSITENQYKIYH